MRKLVTVGLVGLGVLVATAGPASAQWYDSEALPTAAPGSTVVTPDQWYDGESQSAVALTGDWSGADASAIGAALARAAASI